MSTSEGDLTYKLTSSDPGSGVRWNRVVPGFALLRTARDEIQRADPDVSLVRSLYITGVEYLLDGLPADLKPGEMINIRTKLSKKLKVASLCDPEQHHQRYDHRDNGLLFHSDAGLPRSPSSACLSFVQQVVAASVVNFCLLVQFLLPHVGVICQQLRKSEVARAGIKRTFAVSSFVVRKTQAGTVFVGSGLVQTLRTSSLFRALVDLWIAWCFAVINGISDGVTESFFILSSGSGGMEEPQAARVSKLGEFQL